MRRRTILSIISLLLFLCMPVAGQWHWESLVLESDQFRLLAPDGEPASNWMQADFPDSGWPLANGGFGYADFDDNTVVDPTTSIYLRKTINIPSSVSIQQLLLDIDYDDAFVAYINGVEVARSANLLEGTPAFSGSVTYDHEAVMYNGGLPERFVLDPGILVSGDNLLAVHILNVSINSSDMSSRIFLNAELDSDQVLFNDTPNWFSPPVSFSNSNLPIVKFDTYGLAIPDEPKMMAWMQVIDNPDGQNSVSDTTYAYDGDIGIEIRGNTAKMFPKKSYSVETRLSNGENNNLPLFGMPIENDWVFHAPYSDKSLMRNALAHNIGNAMGEQWHPRTRFVEVYLNNEYIGVYLVEEKIKIDKNRVDIATLLPIDTIGDELTGGYIISVDRHQPGSWISPFLGWTGRVEVPFSYVDPKYDELTSEQRDYIREYITEFETVLHGDSYLDPDNGYREYIDIVSFVDYFIITELSKDLDGYRVSMYMHKDKDSNGGKLTMTPFWDYNICFGNANFFSAGNTEGWAYDGIGGGDAYECVFWYPRMRTDPYFETMLKHRWETLREDVISESRINHVIDSIADLLSDAQVRNFDKWNILSSYVWPNNYVGGTYANELGYMKDWIADRLEWIDSQIALIEPINIFEPVVLTSAVSSVTSSSALLGGFVLEAGGDSVIDRGIFLDTLPDPVSQASRISLGSGLGNFYTFATGLKPETQYYIQAYARNEIGAGYGDIMTFTTKEAPVDTTTVDTTTIDTTGIQFLRSFLQVNAYPNPFRESLTIQVDLPASAEISVQLSNMLGAAVIERSMNCTAGRNRIMFRREELPVSEGLLFYTVKINGLPIHSGKAVMH